MKLRIDTGEQLNQPTSEWELTAFEYLSHKDFKEQNKHNEVTSTAHPLTNDR